MLALKMVTGIYLLYLSYKDGMTSQIKNKDTLIFWGLLGMLSVWTHPLGMAEMAVSIVIAFALSLFLYKIQVFGAGDLKVWMGLGLVISLQEMLVILLMAMGFFCLANIKHVYDYLKVHKKNRTRKPFMWAIALAIAVIQWI